MNTLATLDRNRLTPYTVGFDSLFDRLFDTDFHTTSGGFPPYNIVKNDDYNYQIEMALAGYSKKDIDIELKEGNLTVSSKKLEEEIDENTTMVHKGISHRSFKRSFTLSDEMKEKIKDKKAVHSSLGAEAFVKKYKEMEGNGNLDEYSNIHPIVRVHPETGKKILYVNSMYTKQIIDMDKEESDKILKELFLHQERLDFTCRFKWTENAVAIWDNRSTQHQGLTDFFPNRGLGFERVMDRIAIEGDHPQ